MAYVYIYGFGTCVLPAPALKAAHTTTPTRICAIAHARAFQLSPSRPPTNSPTLSPTPTPSFAPSAPPTPPLSASPVRTATRPTSAPRLGRRRRRDFGRSHRRHRRRCQRGRPARGRRSSRPPRRQRPSRPHRRAPVRPIRRLFALDSLLFCFRPAGAHRRHSKRSDACKVIGVRSSATEVHLDI
jgi:hypothetical protein